MKRIFLLLSVCAALGAAGCCCCHGYNDCMDDCGTYSQGGYGDGCDGGRHRHCNLFHHRHRNCPDGGCQVDGQIQAVNGYQGDVQYVGDAGYQGDGRCQSNSCRSSGCRSKFCRHRHRKSCPHCGREYVGGGQGAISPCCGETMCDCCGGDCGVMQAGFCSGGDCGAMGGNCGGCANGNCGGAAPAPGATPPGAPPTPATTSMTHPYDELQALQAAGWTIMESPGTSSSAAVHSGSTLEPVPAPPTTMTAPPVPVRPAGSR